MLTTDQILSKLDNCDESKSFNFITLEHPYNYLVDSRINIFRNSSNKWAIVAEIFSCHTRGYTISVEIRYFGNCLINLPQENDILYNYYDIYPIENVDETIDDLTQSLKADANYWIVRGVQVPLSHDKQKYLDSEIGLKEYEPNQISGEEAARLVVQKNSSLFRANDEELYHCIPKDLQKVLVIDEWFHKEFYQSTYNTKVNLEQWENRPSSYETWQQIAKVIVTGDPSLYKPTLKPNSHWKNWPEGGTM